MITLGLGPIQTPDLRSLLQQLKRELMCELNCHQVGIIQSFDSATQSARVQIAAKRVVYNKVQVISGGLATVPQYIDYPLLVDVPVFVLSGGQGRITMPVSSGDSCLVLFNDRDIDNWFESGAVTPPNSPRVHSLSDGFALVGFRSKANAIGSYSETNIEIRLGGGKMVIQDSGDVELSSPQGGLMNLREKVQLANGSGSLLQALTLVITALSTLNSVKTGGSASASISAAQSAITNLLS